MPATEDYDKEYKLYPKNIVFSYLIFEQSNSVVGSGTYSQTIQYSDCTVTSNSVNFTANYSTAYGTHTIKFYNDNNELIYTANIGTSDSFTLPDDFPTNAINKIQLPNGKNYDIKDIDSDSYANKDLSNLSDTGKNVIDGQWHIMTTTINLTTATAIGQYTLDLSSYLPVDNYNYEVMLRSHIGRNDSSGTNTTYHVYNSELGQAPSVSRFVSLEADGTNFQQANSSYIAIVTPQRHLNVALNYYKLENAYTQLVGYRRIGTNQ